jgi:hypothetical protein
MPDKTFSSAQSGLRGLLRVRKCRRVSSCSGSLGLPSGSHVPGSVAEFAEVQAVFVGRAGTSWPTERAPMRIGSRAVLAVTVIVGVIVSLTFLFGFGNVLALALRLGVPAWVAPLVAPAVDLSVVGLLLSIRHLSMRGAGADAVRPARRLLLASSVVTLALNVAEPLIEGDVGRALFDAVGPLLLIGWAEVGPALLHELATASTTAPFGSNPSSALSTDLAPPAQPVRDSEDFVGVDAELLDRARREDRRHRELHQRPISAESLRQVLGVGAGRSRLLVKLVREEWGLSTLVSP